MVQMKQPDANPMHWIKTRRTQLKHDYILSYKIKA